MLHLLLKNKGIIFRRYRALLLSKTKIKRIVTRRLPCSLTAPTSRYGSTHKRLSPCVSPMGLETGMCAQQIEYSNLCFHLSIWAAGKQQGRIDCRGLETPLVRSHTPRLHTKDCAAFQMCHVAFTSRLGWVTCTGIVYWLIRVSQGALCF